MIDDRKRRFREHFETAAAHGRDYETACDRYMENGCIGPRPARQSSPPLPVDLRGLACGAKTRRGEPCKRTDIYLNGRCKFHGGMSTGARTAEGRARVQDTLAKGRALRWKSGTP